jgi:hypothetical protein
MNRWKNDLRICAPRGGEISARSWPTGAQPRMLMHDYEIAIALRRANGLDLSSMA